MAPDPATHDIERELGLLAANGIRYVVIHKTEAPDHPALDEGVLASWRELFGPEPVYEDDELVVYRLRPGENIQDTPVLQLGEELGVTEVRVRRTWVVPPDAQSEDGVCVSCAAATIGEGWLTVDLTWTAQRDLERDYAVHLTLMSPNGIPLASSDKAAPGESVLISPRYPTSHWPEGVVIADQVALPFDPALPAGEYELEIEMTDNTTGAPLAVTSVPVQVEGEAQPLVPALSEMQYRAGVSYGDEMRLLGCSAVKEDERLHVVLYWQALEAMEDQYKIFVHLLDREGQIVAQHDAMPRNWSYPTTRWGRGEVYVERIALDVSGAEPGAYRLAVGVYEPDTGRLAAVDRDGQRLPDDRAVLGVGELGD
jgi:hypothetical protein